MINRAAGNGDAGGGLSLLNDQIQGPPLAAVPCNAGLAGND